MSQELKELDDLGLAHGLEVDLGTLAVVTQVLLANLAWKLGRDVVDLLVLLEVLFRDVERLADLLSYLDGQDL